MDRHPIFDIIANDLSSSSDDEVEMIIRFAIKEEHLNSGGGSRPGRRRTFIRRDFVQATERIFQVTGPYFVQRRNAAGRLGLSSFQKMTTAIRMLAYGTMVDLCDEYLRSPTNNDIAIFLALGESRGFPGMLRSIDCMHWKWKNCPTAWQGSHNDINVLERSSVFTELAEGRAPLVNYSINDNNYTMGCYLADGIYPPWSTFNSKPGRIQSTGLGSPSDWISPDLEIQSTGLGSNFRPRDPIDWIGVPGDWIRPDLKIQLTG
uniref:Uncharacterized protein n=1 Tax=Fagus sylvatica TaxID=28930 RepID=A0A2N9ILN1_FAGSY